MIRQRLYSCTMWWLEKQGSGARMKIIVLSDCPVRILRRNANGESAASASHGTIIGTVTKVRSGTGRAVEFSFEDGTSTELSLDNLKPGDVLGLRAEMSVQQFVEQFVKLFLKKSGSGKNVLLAVVGGIFGGVAAVVAAPVVLTAVGFTAGGIAAGSMAASMMSAAAVAGGGGVAAGSAVAVLQSVGAVGLGLASGAVVAGTGAVTGAAVTGAAGVIADKIKKDP